jgi:hypothetical protein
MDSLKNSYVNQVKMLNEKAELLAKLQNAVYVTSKKQIVLMEKANSNNISYSDQINELIAELKELKEEQSKLTKVVIKYNREDTKYLIAKNKVDTDKVVKAISNLDANIDKMKQDIIELKEIRSNSATDDKQQTEEPIVTQEPVAELIEDIVTEEPVVEEPVAEQSIVLEETIEPSIEPVIEESIMGECLARRSVS